MDISSIGIGFSVGRSSAVGRTLAPDGVTTSQPSDVPATVPTPRVAPKKSEQVPLDVQISTRPDGGRQLTIMDKTTGQIYCQLPPERVVALLEEALRRMQHLESE